MMVDAPIKARAWFDRRARFIWPVFAVMSTLILLSAVFFMLFPEITFDITMEYPGSSLRWEDLDESSKVGMRFLVLRPFWDETIFGMLGLFCAWRLKRRDRFAWNLGAGWGVVLLAAGIALGLSEIAVGRWPSVCVVTILYVTVGAIALICLFLVKQGIDESA
jgi:hypothetical protein